MTQVMGNVTAEDSLLELLLKSNQEMFGDGAVKGSLNSSNLEIVELKNLTGVTKKNNYNTELQKNLSCSVI